MTYALYLVIFLGAPLLVLATLLQRGSARGRRAALRSLPALSLAAHVLIAVVYTTPWDNYLVASGVWWYDPQRVLGIVLGWVPIEEYSFFVLQTVMTGMGLFYMMRRPVFGWQAQPQAEASGRRWRLWRPGLAVVAGLGAVWLLALALLAAGWQPGVYLGLELGWFVPPIMLQVAVGGEVLWRHRRLVAAASLAPALYLSLTDAYAIDAGIWMISRRHSLGLTIGPLPIEEIVFFLLTNVLITFGITLVLVFRRHAPASRQ